MKKIIYIFLIGFIIVGGSCDKGCDGCGPSGGIVYFMKKNLNEDVNLIWYGPSLITQEFKISKRNRILLYEANRLGHTGELKRTPFRSIDSVKLEKTSDITIYLKDECNLAGNPLCKANYKLIYHINTKNLKVEQWEFEIK